MNSLLLLNGSPRGERSNSMKMLARVTEGWQRGGGSPPEILHLARRAQFQRAVEAFATADTVLLGTPLYTDAMPALVKAYIEALAPRVAVQRNPSRCTQVHAPQVAFSSRKSHLAPLPNGHCCSGSALARAGGTNPSLAFLVQSGFPEASHSRPLERYFKKLALRLGSPYTGTIVHGGGEALQAMPDAANKKLWARLRVLGEQLARDGHFGVAELKAVAGVERFSRFAVAVFSLACKIPASQFYWNGMLKKNGAWERRFAAPYGPAFR